MGILVVMKNWAGPSELWLRRQLDMLEPHLAALAAPRPETRRWRGRVPVIALDDQPPSALRRAAKVMGLDVWQKPRVSSQARLGRAVQDRHVSAIFCHYLDFTMQFDAVWRDTDKPLFVHCHGYDVTWDLRFHHLRYGERRHDDLYPQRVRELARRAVLIANSRRTADRLFDIQVPEDRVVVKYLGVEVPAEPPQRKPRTKGLTILYLGRLVDFKGPDLVIQAFDRACAHGLDGRLRMAGDGHMRVTCESLRARSRFADRIEMLGAVDRETGIHLRRRADIFTAHNCTGPLTRQEEAFGVSYTEAMADALPVVSGHSGSLPELIDHGEHGLLIEPGDIDAHARALLKLAGAPDERRRMGENAWRRARERFAIDQEKEELFRILNLR